MNLMLTLAVVQIQAAATDKRAHVCKQTACIQTERRIWPCAMNGNHVESSRQEVPPRARTCVCTGHLFAAHSIRSRKRGCAHINTERTDREGRRPPLIPCSWVSWWTLVVVGQVQMGQMGCVRNELLPLWAHVAPVVVFVVAVVQSAAAVCAASLLSGGAPRYPWPV